MSVFKSVEVCGLELAVISSLGCTYAAADRDGAIYAYWNRPDPIRQEGCWLDTKTGNRTMLVPANVISMKRGAWLRSLAEVSEKVFDIQ
jgi:hypothetical protein